MVGYSGKDRTVYEADIGDGPRRVAITVGDNGYIVGANPIPFHRILRPHKERGRNV